MIRDGSGKSGRCFCAIFLTWCYFCYRIDSQKKKNASSAMIMVSSARDFSDAWYNRTLYRLLTTIIKYLNHWLLSGSDNNISIRPPTYLNTTPNSFDSPRCDQTSNCFDESDEDNCKLLFVKVGLKYFLSDPCAHGVRSLGRLCLYVSMRGFWNLVKTVNVVNVDTLVDDPSEDLSWRP